MQYMSKRFCYQIFAIFYDGFLITWSSHMNKKTCQKYFRVLRHSVKSDVDKTGS